MREVGRYTLLTKLVAGAVARKQTVKMAAMIVTAAVVASLLTLAVQRFR